MAVCSTPALPNVWAASLLTNGAQLQLAQVALDLGELVPARQRAFQPVRLSCLLLKGKETQRFRTPKEDSTTQILLAYVLKDRWCHLCDTHLIAGK